MECSIKEDMHQYSRQDLLVSGPCISLEFLYLLNVIFFCALCSPLPDMFISVNMLMFNMLGGVYKTDEAVDHLQCVLCTYQCQAPPGAVVPVWLPPGSGFTLNLINHLVREKEMAEKRILVSFGMRNRVVTFDSSCSTTEESKRTSYINGVKRCSWSRF